VFYRLLMNSDFFYFCLLLLVSSLSFGFVMVCLDGNSAIRVGSESPLYRELVRREFVKRTFRIVLVACAMLACMAMLFRNAPSGWFDAAQRQPMNSPAPEGQATNGSKPAAGEKAQAEGSAKPQSASQGSAKSADEQRSGGSGETAEGQGSLVPSAPDPNPAENTDKQQPAEDSEKRGKRTPSDLALDFCEFLLAILAISLAFKNFRIGNENTENPGNRMTFGVESFLALVGACFFALFVYPICSEFLNKLSYGGRWLIFTIVMVFVIQPVVAAVGFAVKDSQWYERMKFFKFAPLMCLGFWAGGLISWLERAGLAEGNSAADQMLRLLGVLFLNGASCSFLARKPDGSGGNS
jgi:hypothetical protein